MNIPPPQPFRLSSLSKVPAYLDDIGSPATQQKLVHIQEQPKEHDIEDLSSNWLYSKFSKSDGALLDVPDK